MRIEQLHYFTEIAKTCSISLAAENLFVTQPAISNAIKKLEEELDIVLFTRSKNGVFLTPAGVDILSASEAIIALAAGIQETVDRYKAQSDQAIIGTLKLQIVPPINLRALPEIMPLFNRRYPHVTLNIMENNPDEIIKNLTGNDYDLYVFSTLDNHFEKQIPSIIAASPTLVVNYLSSQRLYCLVSEKSPLAQKTSISLKEIVKYPLGTLTYTQEDDDYLSRTLKDFNSANIVFRTNNPIILAEQIAKDHCISVSTTISQNITDIKLIPISNALKLQFYSAYDVNSPQIALITTFLQLLKTKL